MSGWDVAVVGAGIAGLTAARACAARRLRVVAYDALAPGGQLINLGEVLDWPGPPTTGPELAGGLLDDAMGRGVELAFGEVGALTAAGDGWSLPTDDGAVTATAVVVATGLSPGRLEVPDAAAWAGRGLSGCASCDGPLHAGREVVLVGDDEWTAHEAVELAGVAAHVTVLSAGAPTWSPAAARRLDTLATVEHRAGVTVVGLAGDDVLGGVVLAGGEVLPASGVFVQAGKRPRRALLDAVPEGAAGLWTAGDVTTAPSPSPSTPSLLTAAADGLRAGLAAADHVLTR